MSDLAHIPALSETTVPAPQRPNVKRHLLAAALSALLPGAGQLFLGRKKKAIFLLACQFAIGIGFWPLRLPRSYPGLILILWMCLLLSLFAIFDALMAQDFRLPGKMSRWWIFAGIPVHYLSLNFIFTSLLIGSGFRTARFASSAMEPTMFVGDKFVIDKLYYRHHSPSPGDLVFMRRQDGTTVKRVVAVGGNTIQGTNREVFLNGQRLDEPFIQHKSRTNDYEWLDKFGPMAIPAGKYFVMGDNRDTSLDSRYSEFGLLDSQSILGKPLYVYQVVAKPLYRELK